MIKHVISLFAILFTLASCESEEPIINYTLTTTVSPAVGGKIEVTPQSSIFKQGELVTITAVPNENYVFKQWDGDDTSTTNTLKISMNSNKTLIGVFVKRDYPLNLIIEGEGVIEEKIISNPSGREYPHGTTVELTPKPKEGWVFDSWSGDLTGSEIPKNITVDKAKTVTAKFKRKDYLLTIKIEGEGTVEEKIVSSPNGKEYPNGTTVQLIPTAKEGWVFESWSGDLSGTESPKNITIDKPKTVTAKFKRKDYPLTISIEGEGTVDEKIISNPSGREYPFQTIVELTPKPKEGWVFDSWSGDLSGTESPKNITVDKAKTVIAKFKKIEYPLNITIIGEGTVEEKIVSSPSGRLYPFQTVVELIPKPKEGWVFNNWGGDLSGSNYPTTISINGIKNVTVTFIQPIFRIASNGITCECENVTAGSKGMINGVEYEAVDNALIRIRKSQGVDMTKLCTSLVTDLSDLFKSTTFNQNIENWDVSNVTNMVNLFSETPFNQPIGSWDVGKVTKMDGLFSFSLFNQSLSNWNVSNVTSMNSMFSGTSFNQPIGNWNVGSVKYMAGMFLDSKFNQNIGNWNVKNVLDLSQMFEGNTEFNQAIGTWDVSSVTNMIQMFQGTPFNQSLENWNVSNVTSMSGMFRNSPFNQTLDNWDVSKVKTMDSMFSGSLFSKNISGWCVELILVVPQNFSSNIPDSFKPVWGTCPN